VVANDRLYLVDAMPFLLVWGERDPIIPVAHGHDTHERVAHSRFEVFPGAGHFPHLDDAQRFTRVLVDFMRTTEPARLRSDHIRALLAAEATRLNGSGDG
jgi:pimeloyl-ACP methyl ester carboxylesterase